MKNWTVSQRIAWSFGAVITLMLAMGLYAFVRLDTLKKETIEMQTDSMPGLHDSSGLLTEWLALYVLAERHVSVSDRAEHDRLEAEIANGHTEAARSIAVFRNRPMAAEGRSLVDALNQRIEQYTVREAELLRLSRGSDKDAAVAYLFGQLEPEFEQVQAAIQHLVDASQVEIESSLDLILSTAKAAEIGLLIVIFVVLVLAVGSAYSLVKAINSPLRRLVEITESMSRADFTQRVDWERRDEFRTLGDGFNRMADELTALVSRVKESTVQVNTSSTEIAATAKEQQATSSEVAATTSEIGATAKEISATSRELARTVGEVAEVAEQSAKLAGSGRNGLAQMEETMGQVMEAAGGIKAKLAILNEKAGNINQVVTTITKVADQTNLLSLNAAIEAEKAGEYGRGFAVVATEIRRLADQTAVATYDIEQMVKEMQSAVSAGVMGMDKFSEEVRRGMEDVQQVGAQLVEIIQQVQALAPRVEAVSEGVQAQSTGAEQISEALEQLSEAAQQTVESLRQSSIAIEGLNTVSRDLRDGVSRFKLKA